MSRIAMDNGPPPTPTNASATARSTHATRSSTAAQVMAVVPKLVLWIPRSSRMRASTGNAVMLIAMPRNITNGKFLIPCGAKRVRSGWASRTPKANGAKILSVLDKAAVARWW